MPSIAPINKEVQAEIRKFCQGELRLDETTRWLYSTDASIYQIKPLGVFFPHDLSDLNAVMEICARYRIPVLPRGSGSSLAGQAVGEALVLDLSHFLHLSIHINVDERTADVDPGVTLTRLNREAALHGLVFGPDPASADRATVGGSAANNATGAHSIVYGMFADHLLAVNVVLADGTTETFKQVTLQRANQIAQNPQASINRALYRAALEIRERHGDTIRKDWPRVWRKASGYNIQMLMPWSPAEPPLWREAWNSEHMPYPPAQPGTINLAPLFAGSEGTLGILSKLTVRLVPIPAARILAVKTYPSIDAACDDVPRMLELKPSAIELIPGSMIRLARSVPAYAHQVGFVDGEPEALLVIEFSGSKPSEVLGLAGQLGSDVLLAKTPVDQARVWNVRKMGLGILNSRAGDEKPLAFVEDLAVPVQRLGEFAREMDRIMRSQSTTGEFYAHASAGCLHIRPILSLKSTSGIEAMRAIAAEAVDLTISLGGAVSGEHGDGLARSEWITRAFGPEIAGLFAKIKQAADPDNLLNPGKILNPKLMDQNLRYEPGYQADVWNSALDFSRQAGLDGAIEMCNGAGVCRKEDGLMCPSFQATHEEQHSTRGRANLLRLMISGQFSSQPAAEQAVFQALDLCLACKGCKSECPSAVDVAKLKYAFLEHYYRSHRRSLRDYLFAYIGTLAGMTRPIAGLANFILSSAPGSWVKHTVFNIAAQRQLPTFTSSKEHAEVLASWGVSGGGVNTRNGNFGEQVLYLSDAFSRYMHPETEAAALLILNRLGARVKILPQLGAGRTYLTKGFLKQGQMALKRLVNQIHSLDPAGKMPIIGVEPSEIYTLRDELLELLPGDEYARGIAERSWMLDEFLVRKNSNQSVRMAALSAQLAKPEKPNVNLHGHCYQKAQPPAADGEPVGTEATRMMLSKAGYQVEEIHSGCCGMAGAFGYEAEHYTLSMQVGELSLFPSVRSTPSETWIAAAGTSCRSQIQDGTDRLAVHPIVLVGRLLLKNP